MVIYMSGVYLICLFCFGRSRSRMFEKNSAFGRTPNPKPNYIETRYIFDFDTCSYKVTVWMTSFLPERSQKLLIIRTSWFFTIVSTKFTFEGFLSFMNWTEFTWLCTCNSLLQYFHDKIIAFQHFLIATCSSPLRVYGWLLKKAFLHGKMK